METQPAFPALPPLNALKAFAVAARRGGFRAAAEEMNVTHSVIGRHVRGLEARLGVRLFEAQKRGVRLTPAGRDYYDKIAPALAAIGQATEELQRQFGARGIAQDGKGQVKILTVAGFGSRWLAPRLPDLAAAMAPLSIVVEPAVDFTPVLEGKADLGIGFDEAYEVPGDLELLARPGVFPVCSPDYAARRGPFEKPEDFLGAELLHEDFGEWWEDWFAANGLDVDRDTRLVFSTSTQAIDAAINHQGIALANPLLVTAELDSGRLTRLPSRPFTEGAYWLIWRDRHDKNPNAAKIADWMKAELGKGDEG
ncbi:MAG: LysR substrate-binding domain-containing protein [Pseudomonadota bacterium]